jgi:signal transduction histidine kinase
MFAITIESMLRIAGLMVLLISALPFVNSATSFSPIDWLQALLPLTIFAACFWMGTREIPVRKETTLSFLLLLAQSIAGMCSSSNFLYIVAFEAPLVLARRRAIWFIFGQIITYSMLILIFNYLGRIKLVSVGVENIGNPLYLFFFSTIVWQLFAFTIGWLAANEARSRQKAAQLNAELVLAQQELAEKSRAEERLRISRDLHDAVGHQLVALSLQLDVANRLPESARGGHISTAQTLAKQMLTEVRGAVSLLREERENDLRAALQTLIATIPEPKIHLSISCDIEHLNAATSRTLWRCIQEAVNNTVKHARASNLWIDFSRHDTALALSIRDDGIGNGQLSEGNGLVGMRERLVSIGGSLIIHSQADKGFALEMSIPFQGGAA